MIVYLFTIIDYYEKTKTMENKKTLSFIPGIIAIILGVTLYKKFDFETLRFENTALAIIYIIVFLASVFILIKNIKTRS